MRILCTLVNNARTMYISQQCAYYVHYSTNAHTVYITQQCAYYVHYSTMRVLCTLVNNARTMYISQRNYVHCARHYVH